MTDFPSIAFALQWLTSNDEPLDSEPLAEGAAAVFPLKASVYTEVIVPFTETINLMLPFPAAEISAVELNNILIAEDLVTRSARLLTIQNTDPISISNEIITIDTIELTIDRTLTGSIPEDLTILVGLHRAAYPLYQVINGSLPPGLVLDNHLGVILGTVKNVPGEEGDVISYNFTVRAEAAGAVRDRLFTLRATPTEQDTSFTMSALPDPVTDGALTYYPFGTLKKVQFFSHAFELTDADESLPDLELRSTGLSGDFIEGLPKGLLLTSDGVIKGTVDPAAEVGRYLFKLGFVGQMAGAIIGEFIIDKSLSISVIHQARLEWDTPPFLGTIRESYPSSFRVKATSSKPVTINYRLEAHSKLPKGLTLDKTTGEIRGQAAMVKDDTDFSFTIRADGGGEIITRTFTIRVRSLYNGPNVIDVTLKLRTVDKVGLMDRYSALIQSSALYRADDANFGLPDEPFVYLVKGIKGNLKDALVGDGESFIGLGKDYHGPLTVLLGKHRHAVARDAEGKALYDVIYRNIIDPQAKAGGFSFQTSRAQPNKVRYPQASTPIYIHPKSIRNARLDFIHDLGFSTTDTTLEKLAGPEGIEGLPEWMLSPQVADDPSSVLGYVPALVVGYVEPGKGAATVTALNADSGLPKAGHQVTFDRYFTVTFIGEPNGSGSGTTIFDDDTTTFDGSDFSANRIIFDPELAT